MSKRLLNSSRSVKSTFFPVTGFCLLLYSDIIPYFVATLKRADHMLVVLWHWGGPLINRTWGQSSTVQVTAQAFPSQNHSSTICRRPLPPLSKPARSTLHPDIIIVTNRSHICVAWLPRQKPTLQAVSTPVMAVPAPFWLRLSAWAVKQSRSTTCVYCVLYIPAVQYRTPDLLLEDTYMEEREQVLI